LRLDLRLVRRGCIGVMGWWVVRVLHHVHRMRRVRMMLGRRRMGRLKVSDMGRHDLVFPFML